MDDVATPIRTPARVQAPAAAQTDVGAGARRRLTAESWARELAPHILEVLEEGAEAPRVLLGDRLVRLDQLARGSTSVPPLDGTSFASGAGRREDFVALAVGARAIGITSGAGGEALLARGIAHMAAGGRLFVDSGAFREAMEPDLSHPVDFERVFDDYYQLLDGVRNAVGEGGGRRLTIVLPDRPRHQEESLRRLQAFAPDARCLIEAGVDALLPIQAPNPEHPEWGDLDAGAYWRRAVAILGTTQVRAAFPCARGRWPLHAVAAFLHEHRPAGVHLLGMGDRSRLLADWEGSIRRILPEAVVTRDACPFTALLGDGREMTERNRSLNDALRAAIADAFPIGRFVQSIYEEPAFTTPEMARDLALGLNAAAHLGGDDAVDRMSGCAGLASDARWEHRMDRGGWRTAIRSLEGQMVGGVDIADCAHNSRIGFLVDRCLAGQIAAGGHAPIAVTFCAQYRTWIDQVAVPIGRGVAAFTAVAGEAAPSADTGLRQLDLFVDR